MLTLLLGLSSVTSFLFSPMPNWCQRTNLVKRLEHEYKKQGVSIIHYRSQIQDHCYERVKSFDIGFSDPDIGPDSEIGKCILRLHKAGRDIGVFIQSGKLTIYKKHFLSSNLIMHE